MKVVVPKEIMPNERRVALVPDAVGRLVQSGYEVFVECGAGEHSFFPDHAYQDVGATLLDSPKSIYGTADVVLKVQRPIHNEVLACHEIELMQAGAVLIAFLDPMANLELVKLMMKKRIASFSMDSIPRIASAQKMDAITSMSSISGYKAVLIAAHSSGKFFPMMMTAAGTIAPAKGLVLGAGVAGLQAIATARRLGAVMWAFDIRPAVKEQIESLGAKFVEVQPETSQAEGAGGYALELNQEAQDRERAAIHKHVADADFVITTALVPGKTAPILITKEMVISMRPGSVIVDLAAESGGNCELTRPGEDVMEHGIILHGPINLPSSMAIHASQMYSRNISALLVHLTKDQSMYIDLEDAISQACCITHNGNVVHGPTMAMLQN